MTTFKLHVTCDNAAFEAIDPDASQGAHDNERNAEVARILRYVADRVSMNTAGPVIDVNGNRVGEYGFDDSVRDLVAAVGLGCPRCNAPMPNVLAGCLNPACV